MTNEQNLKKFKKGEQRTIECAKKGGEAKHRNDLIKKDAYTLANMLLNTLIKKDSNIETIKSVFDDIEKNQITRNAKWLAQIASYLEDPNIAPTTKMKIYEFILKVAGQGPIEKQEVTNIDKDGYRHILMDDEDIFEGDYGSADESDEEEEDKKE